jgi:hypothetical protein
MLILDDSAIQINAIINISIRECSYNYCDDFEKNVGGVVINISKRSCYDKYKMYGITSLEFFKHIIGLIEKSQGRIETLLENILERLDYAPPSGGTEYEQAKQSFASFAEIKVD